MTANTITHPFTVESASNRHDSFAFYMTVKHMSDHPLMKLFRSIPWKRDCIRLSACIMLNYKMSYTCKLTPTGT